MILGFLFLHVVLSAYISYLDFVPNLPYAVSVNRRCVIIRMTITCVTVVTHQCDTVVEYIVNSYGSYSGVCAIDCEQGENVRMFKQLLNVVLVLFTALLHGMVFVIFVSYCCCAMSILLLLWNLCIFLRGSTC